MIKKASRSRTFTPRYQQYAWPYKGCFLSVASALLCLMASVSELRELSCRSDTSSAMTSSAMTCQLTYRSLMTKHVKTVQGVKSVSINQNIRPDLGVGRLMLDPNKTEVTLITKDGPSVLRVYGSQFTNAVLDDELSQLRDRLRILERSPSEGLSILFSRKIGHDFRSLLLRLLVWFILLVYIVLAPAFPLLLIFHLSVCGIRSTAEKRAVKKKTSRRQSLPSVEPENFLDVATFSQRLNAFFCLHRDTCLASTELSDWKKQQAQSFAIYRLAAAIAKQEPLLTRDLSDTLRTVLQLGSQFSAVFETACTMKVLAYSTATYSTANRQALLPYQKMAQQRFWTLNQRLSQLRHCLSHTQQQLSDVETHLWSGGSEADYGNWVSEVSTRLRSLIDTNKRELVRR